MSPEGPPSPATALAPGFRFHPTDEELVWYYLKRKVTGQTLRFDAISEADIYKCEPWDLPGKSRLKSRDLEWYFFSALDKKYGNGSRMNRATIKGYWKTTGKDRGVRHNSRIVGMKKTLVFHSGRAPGGERTNWVMHEYRLADQELEKTGITQDGFVLCRVFQKSGLGPPNGDRYAPFVEEEWDDDNENGATVLVPGEEEEERVKEESLEDGPVLSMACPSPFPVGGKRFRMESDGSEISPPAGTQDRGSSTNAPAMAGEKVSSSVMEFPLLESIDRGAQGSGGLSGFLPAGYLKLFGDLQCEIHSVSAQKAAYKIELMSTQAMVGVLQSRIDWLVKENEGLNRIVRERFR